MEQQQKERLVGATVLVIVAVIFVPMILDEATESGKIITKTNIPQKQVTEFNSRIVPLADARPQMNKENKSVEIKNTVAEDPVISDENPVAISNVDAIDETEKLSNERISEGVGLTAWVVQLGSFNARENAHSLKQQLRDAGFPAFVEPYEQGGKTMYRVRVGPEVKRSDANELLSQIKQKIKKEGIVVTYP